MDDIERRVKAVTASVLNADASTIKASDRFVQDLGAASIQGVELVAGFEEEFGLEMDEAGAFAVKTVGGAVEFIRNMVEQSSEQGGA